MNPLFPALALGLGLLISACNEDASRPAPPPPFSDPPGPPAVAGVPAETHQNTVRLFLDSLARRDTETGWALLSRESQALYPSLAEYTRQTREQAEIASDLLADDQLRWSTRPVAPDTQVGVTTVSGETRREGMKDYVARSWVTRFQQGRLTIEFPPIANETLYRWENPEPDGDTSGVYQGSTPLAIAFPVSDADASDVEQVYISIDERVAPAPMAELDVEDGRIRYTFMPDDLAPGPHVATVTWRDRDLHLWHQATAGFVILSPDPH